MSRLRMFLARLRGLVGMARSDRDLHHEIASHLAEATEEYVLRGLSPDEARRAALLSFGGVAQVEEQYREHRSFRWLEDFGRDLKYGIRSLRRSVAFSLVVLTVLTLGTGGITTVFTLLNRIVFRPLPFPQADQVVVIKHSAPGLNRDEVGLSSGLYFHYREHARSLDALGVYRRAVSTFRREGSGTERVQIAYSSATVFHVLRVSPTLGRLFTTEDGAPGFLNTTWEVPILLAHDFWADHLGGDAGIVGKIVTMGNSPRKIVGVMPNGFHFPDPDTQIWVLLEPPRISANFAGVFSWDAIARLRSGVTRASAQAELQAVLPQVVGAYRDATPARLAEARLSPLVIPLKTEVITDIGHVLWTLVGGMVLLLVIAWINAAALFAVRADHRRREMAVRDALGAHRHQVMRLFMTEAMVLTGAAAAFGLLLAKGLIAGVISLAPEALPRASEIRIGATEIVVAALLAIVLAVFYGALPAYRHGHGAGSSVLAGGHRVTGRLGRWGGHPVIALQMALALTLMVGSALMVKTYRNLSRSELGFSSDHLLTVQVGLPGSKAGQHVRIYDDVVRGVRRLPGVEDASVASFVPLTRSEDVFPVEAGAAPIPFKFFAPGYFQTMKTRIVEGERFMADDHVASRYPVLVSAALARRLYPAGDAIGKTVRRLNEDGSIVEMGNRGPVPPFVIVGVVANVREISLRDKPTELVYIPLIEPHVEQSIVPTNVSLVIRTRVPPLSVVVPVRAAVTQVDPTLSVGQVQTMDAIVRRARGREAFVGVLLLLAAVVSLFLGTVGVYGSVTQVVKRRTREIGIRVTLGAGRAEVVRMVAENSLRSALVGTGVGLIVALAATRALQSILFGVEANDPGSLIVVTALLLTAAIAAALVAASRAARVDPSQALRIE